MTIGREPRLVCVALAAALGTACAARMGGQATEGAITALRESAPPPGSPTPGERVGQNVTGGALLQLSSPEGLERLTTVVDAAVTRSLEAALRGPRVQARGGHGGGYGGGHGYSLVERMAHDSASAFGAAFSGELERALGPDGRGPLAASLGETAAQVSGSAVRGARGELGELVPGCEGEDDGACVEAKVRSLGRAAAAGFVEGVAGSVAWAVLAVAFGAGVVATLAAAAAWGLLRNRHARAEARP